MNPTKRIIVNTSAQYIRSILNMGLALFSARFVLHALSVSDYGIYSLVAGTIALLGFVTNALMTTTQRFLSYHAEQADETVLKKLFVSSSFLHIIIAFSLFVVLSLMGPWLIGMLNIPSERLHVALPVYWITAGMLALTIYSSPFKALFIVHEDIVFVSVVDVLDALLKFVLAYFLVQADGDRLLLYAWIMAAILVFNMCCYLVCGLYRYSECTLLIRRCHIDRKYIRDILSFAGWGTYGMGSVAARNQGLAIVFNLFYGTVVNAAYGLANQIYGAISFVASSLLNAMNPQIMKAEGAGDHARMSRLARKECLYSTLLMSIVTIPLVVEMPQFLQAWLGEIPEYTVMLSRFILISFLFDQLTYGLNTAVQAGGRLRLYTLLVYTPKLLTPILICILSCLGYGLLCSMCVYLVVEMLVSFVRIPYCSVQLSMSYGHFLQEVVCPLMPVVILEMVICLGLHSIDLFDYQFLFNTFVSCVSGVIGCLFLTLKAEERLQLIGMFLGKLKRR